MKKALTLILAAGLLIAALAACGSKTTPKDYDLAAMAADLKDNGGYSDIISPVVKDVAAKLYNVDAAGIGKFLLARRRFFMNGGNCRTFTAHGCRKLCHI